MKETYSNQLNGAKQRNVGIDIAKGIAMLFVVSGHIGFGATYSNIIHVFHVPLFFVITGYLFYFTKKRSFGNTLIRKTKALLIPYFCMSLFHVAIYLFAEKIGFFLKPSEGPSIITAIVFNSIDSSYVGFQWFLTALFFASILFEAINRIRPAILRIGVLLIVISISICSKYFWNILFPFSINQACVALLFLEAGYLYASKENGASKSAKIVICFVGVICLLLAFVINMPVNYRTENWGIFPVHFSLSIAVCLMILIACLHLSEPGVAKVKNTVIAKGLSFIGRNSLVFLCFNEIIIILLRNMLSRIAPTVFWCFHLKEITILLFTMILLSIISVLLKPLLRHIQ